MNAKMDKALHDYDRLFIQLEQTKLEQLRVSVKLEAARKVLRECCDHHDENGKLRSYKNGWWRPRCVFCGQEV